MIVVALMLAAALGWTAGAAVLYVLDRRREDRAAAAAVPRRMRLHIVTESGADEASVEGIFIGYESDHYRLANARHVTAHDDPVPLDGEAWIPRSRVLYAQIIG